MARSGEGDHHGRRRSACPGAVRRPGGSRPGGRPERSIGLISATGLVIGSIIGIGVFTMPAVPASAGTSSLICLTCHDRLRLTVLLATLVVTVLVFAVLLASL